MKEVQIDGEDVCVANVDGKCYAIGSVLNFLLDLMPDILKMIEDVVYSSDIISRERI